MLCESVNSDQEEKEGDLLNGNRIINLIYCDAADSGPVQGGSKTARGTGPKEMV